MSRFFRPAFAIVSVVSTAIFAWACNPAGADPSSGASDGARSESTHAGRWIRMGSSSAGSVAYADSLRVRTPAGIQMWELTVHPPVEGEDRTYTRNLTVYDCDRWRTRLLVLQNLKGDRMVFNHDYQSDSTEWNMVVPESHGEAMFVEACRGRQ